MALGKEKTGDLGLRIGGLLRVCHEGVQAAFAARMRAAGFEPMNGTVARALAAHPDGLRLTELATRAKITKQSMAEFVDAMERAGHVERVPDPADARARLVRFTRTGWRASKTATRIVGEIEDEWVAELGARRFEELKRALSQIAARRPE